MLLLVVDSPVLKAAGITPICVLIQKKVLSEIQHFVRESKVFIHFDDPSLSGYVQLLAAALI